ncbi:KDGP aldolase [Moorella sp. Hama-1]|uniref:KDGP aldolase n=1 Tax=Moorella sp. Hama-1 TaxID=2138101 RepID=UPI000D647989|nr:KDGP aldolase [Moorella sp. Hama-1]BCV22337.1 4-hydroxy-2-ketovalerate aldolase [Moorella sp. Hama-1]
METRIKLINGKCAVNVLARDPDNARELYEAAEGSIIIGVLVKKFPTDDECIDYIRQLQGVVDVVSIGLGQGDPGAWQRVATVAAGVDAGHVNQVFPATAYTIGLLKARGLDHQIVNALVAPSGKPGWVRISTGPLSEKCQEQAVVPAEVAATMVKEIGGQSIKFFPIEGTKHLDEVRAMARAAVQAGITMFEPTGGLTPDNVDQVVAACLEEGCQVVTPHIYGALVDKRTGLTNVAAVKEIMVKLQKLG